MITGIDVSHFEPAIDWKQAKTKSDVQWMYTKASQGSDFVDWSLTMHTSAARTAGVLTQAYHFFMANVDPQAQLKNFLGAVHGVKLDLGHMLDWEAGSVQGQSPNKQIACAQVILDGMEKATGKTPWLYMGLSLAQELSLPNSFNRYPLIVAAYGRTLGQVKAPIPWIRLAGWQWTDSGKIAGVAAGHSVDCNYFFGTIDDLKAL